MAGEWIKMRGELLTHPRFLSLCNSLIFGDNPGLLLYVCGEDALGVGAVPPSSQSVTDRALRCVTEEALRGVALFVLLRVWCAVNSHCKVDKTDGVMDPMTLEDLDDVAGFDGFGAALERVGWVRVDGPKSLRFPNFLEFNEPACLRRPAKTSAERQRDYRLRHPKQTSVTESNGSNDREEKRREESNTPLTPQRGDDDFDRFWAAYPRKEAKTAARKAWRKLKPAPAALDLILADVARRAASEKWRENNGEFIPHPASYLNGRRWEDEGVTLTDRPDPEVQARYAARHAEDD